MKDPKRKIFHFDHVKPVGEYARIYLRWSTLPKTNYDDNFRSDVAWILRDENRNLDNSKYRTNRAEPFRCYETCGIRFMDQEEEERARTL